MNMFQILTGLLTPIIACIALYIAWQQHVTAKRKLRLELYEKRYRIYVIIKKYLSSGGNSNDDLKRWSDFDSDTNEAKFLFSNDIKNYIEDIKKRNAAIKKFSVDLENREKNPFVGKDS